MEDLDNNANKEFVPEYFIWLDPEEQKEKAIELKNMTKKKDKRR